MRQAGEDLAQGQAVFHSGQRLLSPEMGMLASLGFAHADVFRSLKVAIFRPAMKYKHPAVKLSQTLFLIPTVSP